MTSKKVFKVVRVSNNKLVSLYINDSNLIEYELNKTSYPKIGKLFCFDNLKAVWDYEAYLKYDIYNFKLLYGTGTNVYKTNRAAKLSKYLTFWNYKRSHKGVPNYICGILWSGTVLASSFTPEIDLFTCHYPEKSLNTFNSFETFEKRINELILVGTKLK